MFAPLKTRLCFLCAMLLAIAVGLFGLMLTYKALHDWHFLRTGTTESLAICTDNPHMDCNPRGWGPMLLWGAGLGLIGLAGAFWGGLSLIREYRSPRASRSPVRCLRNSEKGDNLVSLLKRNLGSTDDG